MSEEEWFKLLFGNELDLTCVEHLRGVSVWMV